MKSQRLLRSDLRKVSMKMNLMKTFLLGLAVASLNAPLAFSQTVTPPKPKQPIKAVVPAAEVKPTHDVVQYKDPEDMTTRYRPGNNKTTVAPPAAPAVTPATAEQSKKHLAGVKYEDRSVGFPACDGASKEGASCAPSPSTSGAKTKAAAPKTKP
jgi:hypothetical protein